MKLFSVDRPANVTPLVARQMLARSFPKAKVASFGVSPDGTQYQAKLAFERVADIPPQFRGKEDDDEGASDEPPAPDDGPDSEPVDDEDDAEKPKEPKKEKGDKKGELGELLNIVKEIAKAVGVVDPTAHPEDALPPDAGLDVPPPPGADGPPPPPVADKVPLPPPAKPGGAGGLGTPFAHVQELRQKVAGKRVFTAVRTDIFDENGNEYPSIKIANDARALFPDAELVKFELKNAKVNGGAPQRVALLGFKRKA